MTAIFSAFTTTTKSPVSTCGVYSGLRLPRRVSAIRVARRPSVSPSASTRYQRRSTSCGFRVPGLHRSQKSGGPRVRRARDCSSRQAGGEARAALGGVPDPAAPERAPAIRPTASHLATGGEASTKRRRRSPARVGLRFGMIARPVWMRRHTFQETASVSPSRSRTPLDDRRGSLGRARAGELALGRERDSRYARAPEPGASPTSSRGRPPGDRGTPSHVPGALHRAR